MSQFVIYSCIKMHTLENLATVKTELVRNYWLETSSVLALWPQTQYCTLFKFQCFHLKNGNNNPQHRGVFCKRITSLVGVI